MKCNSDKIRSDAFFDEMRKIAWPGNIDYPVKKVGVAPYMSTPGDTISNQKLLSDPAQGNDNGTLKY